MTYNQKKNESIVADQDITEMIELAVNDFEQLF